MLKGLQRGPKRGGRTPWTPPPLDPPIPVTENCENYTGTRFNIPERRLWNGRWPKGRLLIGWELPWQQVSERAGSATVNTSTTLLPTLYFYFFSSREISFCVHTLYNVTVNDAAWRFYHRWAMMNCVWYWIGVRYHTFRIWSSRAPILISQTLSIKFWLTKVDVVWTKSSFY